MRIYLELNPSMYTNNVIRMQYNNPPSCVPPFLLMQKIFPGENSPSDIIY